MEIIGLENDVEGFLSQCDHCGNRTVLYIRAEYKYVDDFRETGGDSIDNISWRILQCSACYGFTVQEGHIIEHGELLEGYDETHYPSIRLPLGRLPKAVMKAYDASLKVRRIEPNACAVLVGRTLEAACNHERAQGRTLADKLNYLARTGRIPDTLAEMAQQLRELRNLGAHDAEDEVTEEDVPIILDFLDAILEYLYVAPAKIEAVRARLKKTPKPISGQLEE